MDDFPDYLRHHNVVQIVDEMLRDLLLTRPSDPIEQMAHFFSRKVRDRQQPAVRESLNLLDAYLQPLRAFVVDRLPATVAEVEQQVGEWSAGQQQSGEVARLHRRQRGEGTSRMEDGAHHPVAVASLCHCLPDEYCPSMDAEGALRQLVDRGLADSNAMAQLLQDYHAKDWSQLQAAMDSNHRLALFAYSYEMKEPGTEQSTPYQIYRDMNAKMRSQLDSPEGLLPYHPLIYYINAALQLLPDSETMVLRGLSQSVCEEDYAPGNDILWPAFSSTSSSVEVAKTFLGSADVGAMFVIHACHAKDIKSLSSIAEEDEVLLPPNACLRVLGAAGPGVRRLLGVGDGVQIFEMKQLPQNDVVPMQMLQRGVALWGGHRDEEGRTVLQRVRDGYPGTHYAIYAEAYLHGTHQRYQEARRLYARALQLQPDNVDYIRSYGAQLLHDGDTDTAAILFDKVLAINPWHEAALNNYMHLVDTTGDWQRGKQLMTQFRAAKQVLARQHVHRGEWVPAEVALMDTILADPCSADAATLQLHAVAAPKAGKAPVGADVWHWCQETARKDVPIHRVMRAVWDYEQRQYRL